MAPFPHPGISLPSARVENMPCSQEEPSKLPFMGAPLFSHLSLFAFPPTPLPGVPTHFGVSHIRSRPLTSFPPLTLSLCVSLWKNWCAHFFPSSSLLLLPLRLLQALPHLTGLSETWYSGSLLLCCTAVLVELLGHPSPGSSSPP